MNKKQSLWNSLKTDLFLLVKLNLLFTLSCVPVITIPAGITAVLKICTERIRGREVDLVSDYILYLKTSFFTSLRAGIVQSLLALLFSYVLWFYQTASSRSVLMLGVLRGAASVQLLIIYLAGCYMWVMEAVADLPFRTELARSFQMMIVYIRQSLLALLFGALIFGGAFLLFPYSLAFLAVIGISLWAFTVSYYLFPVVERHVPLN